MNKILKETLENTLITSAWVGGILALMLFLQVGFINTLIQFACNTILFYLPLLPFVFVYTLIANRRREATTKS